MIVLNIFLFVTIYTLPLSTALQDIGIWCNTGFKDQAECGVEDIEQQFNVNTCIATPLH